jgi:magnesium-transporting ATPase (P-type)
MLLPLQQYQFTAPGHLKDLHRKMELMAAQFHPERRQKTLFNKSKKTGVPLYVCTWNELNFTITALKPDGDAGVVQLSGTITPGDHASQVNTQIRHTSAWLANMALSVVMALAVGYTWIALSESLFSLVVTNISMIYVALLLVAVYMNIRHFHHKATQLMEDLVYWLELSETEQ